MSVEKRDQLQITENMTLAMSAYKVYFDHITKSAEIVSPSLFQLLSNKVKTQTFSIFVVQHPFVFMFITSGLQYASHIFISLPLQ